MTIAGLWRYGDWRHVATGCTALVFIKFADDTYLVISAANISTRAVEIDDIATRSAENNLKLNKSKSKEVLFRDNRQGNLKTYPPPLAWRHHPGQIAQDS